MLGDALSVGSGLFCVQTATPLVEFLARQEVITDLGFFEVKTVKREHFLGVFISLCIFYSCILLIRHIDVFTISF